MTIIESDPKARRNYIRKLLSNASIEALPAQVITTPEIVQPLPSAPVFVPFLPGSDLDSTIIATRNLVSMGREVVPHLPARSFQSRDHLSDWLAAIRSTDTKHLLLIAGDTQFPLGPFKDTLDVIDTGLIEQHDIERVFIAGHPEGHPLVTPKLLTDALIVKHAWSEAMLIELHVVTQFTFDIPRFINWLDQVNQITNSIPVHLGIAGPASPASLAKYALQCGVSLSGKMMLSNRSARKLLTQWNPSALIEDLMRFYPVSRPAAIHIFPFGGISKTSEWIKKMTLFPKAKPVY